ncbi:hypothetical protein BKA67DRAFT_537601 [Truncatella angustata]|uniref:Uncharacterized protein n=1 Tax=Truncatella angustata TaxID=152316 RepID=A0A9P8UGJ9_9PEZI|nr:uncharacterized protein BKA67DRAFT_537601 [Truncatella angustata]KAH6651743.1 hypothetical protein BKA67DRAFT_537601 [Truncatella angustata]
MRTRNWMITGNHCEPRHRARRRSDWCPPAMSAFRCVILEGVKVERRDEHVNQGAQLRAALLCITAGRQYTVDAIGWPFAFLGRVYPELMFSFSTVHSPISQFANIPDLAAGHDLRLSHCDNGSAALSFLGCEFVQTIEYHQIAHQMNMFIWFHRAPYSSTQMLDTNLRKTPPLQASRTYIFTILIMAEWVLGFFYQPSPNRDGDGNGLLETFSNMSIEYSEGNLHSLN